MNGPRPRLTAFVSALALTATLAACGTPHPGISNGSVSGCYRAIPTARDAVHDSHATLIGVHRVAADRVKLHLPAAGQAELGGGDNDTSVCAYAFKGTFTPGQVELAPPAEQGKYAVVLVTTSHLDVLASSVLTHLPHFLGKRTL
jgi:hypothetical protein